MNISNGFAIKGRRGMSLSAADLFSLFDKVLSGRKKAGYIGFDLGSEKLNLVQIDFSLSEPQIMAAVSVYHNSDYSRLLEEPERLHKLVKAALQKHRFRGCKTVATVPNALLKLLFVNYACKAHEEESSALINALQSRVNHSLNDYVIDYLPINPHATEQVNRMALVAMAKRNEVEDYLDLLTECGLKPVALEIGPVAIQRLVSLISEEGDSEKILVINFATHKSYLTVLWNREVLLDRELEFGMDHVLKSIARAFDVSEKTALEVLHRYGLSEPEADKTFSQPEDSLLDEESGGSDESIRQVLLDILKPGLRSLTNEIRDVLVYVASETRGGAVEQIFLMGSLARIAEVDNLIDQLISIPVKTMDPFYGLSHQREVGHADVGPVSGIAVATGLALRGSLDGA